MASSSVDQLCTSLVMCVDCKSTKSSFWHKSNAASGALCTACYCQREGLSQPARRQALSSANSASASKVADELCSLDNNSVKCGSANTTRKSSRLKPLAKNKLSQSAAKPSSTKGRSKRYIFKKNVIISVIFLCEKNI